MSEAAGLSELLALNRADLANTTFEYVRVGYDKRRITFSADGTVSRGCARCEAYWSVRPVKGRPALDIYDDQRELTCRLFPSNDRVWRGRWTRFERMPIELVPVSTGSLPRTLVIQQADGPFNALLRLVYPRHADYALHHGIDFWCIHGEPQTTRDSVWSKILLIRQALHLHYQLVVWLDADTLIVRPEQDIRAALTEFTCVGMCKHPSPWGQQSWHFNAGVVFVRNSEAAQEFFHRVWQSGPTSHPWQEQARILECADATPAVVQAIDDKWNSAEGINPSLEPVIRAWHGRGSVAERYALMQAEIRALEATR